MTVREIMTTPAITIAPDATVYDAAKLMEQHNVGSIPVAEGSVLTGIITDRDITVRSTAQKRDPQGLHVYEIMTRNVATVTPDTNVTDALYLMSETRTRRLPVVAGKRLVGILSLGDTATEDAFSMEASHALAEISRPCRVR
ncbi:MAG: CBS domain-containing protein [Clostridia bacterium]|nr:CBS domain-containing protein [Clostridia bacterium]